MQTLIKKYWLEVIAIGCIFVVLLLCNLPGMTWINTDSDGPHYILSAKYMGVAHNTSAPLFLLLGRLCLYLPFGTEAWRMGLISVLATTICAVFIYKAVKHHTDNKWYGMISALLYGGSALVISQSTIIETYALSTALMVGAYYACLKSRWLLASILMGLILAVHPLFFVLIWVVLFIGYKELRKWKYALSTFVFVVFYAYIPIAKMTGGVFGMWGNSSFSGFFVNNFGTMWMLAGGLSLYDLPKRIIDTIGILAVSMGISLVIVVWHYIRQRTWRDPLMWLFLLPISYFIINLASETYVYMIPAIAFGSISIGIAFARIRWQWVFATALVSCVLISMNAWYFDIGRTLDPNLSAQRFYDEELPKINDGEIYMGGGWTWAIVYLYNKEQGRNIIPICTDILPSQEYLNNLEAQGISLTRTTSESFIDKQWEVALSIAQQNDNVWIAEATIPSEYQYEIVRAKDNMHLITRWLGHEVSPVIAWKPSNPYAFITGSIEITEWTFILKTNHNARFAIFCMIYAIGAYVLFLKLWGKRRETLRAQKEG